MLRYNRDDDTTCGSLAASSFPARVSNKASLFCTTLAMGNVRFWLLRPQQFWWPLSQPHCTQWPSTAAPATCCIGRGTRVAYLYEFHATLFIAHIPISHPMLCFDTLRRSRLEVHMFCMTATDWFNMLFVIFGNLQARLQPTQLDIYEAHGTGTSLGDPIEVSAVRKVRGGLDLVGWGLGSWKITSTINLGRETSSTGIVARNRATSSMADAEFRSLQSKFQI